MERIVVVLAVLVLASSAWAQSGTSTGAAAPAAEPVAQVTAPPSSAPPPTPALPGPAVGPCAASPTVLPNPARGCTEPGRRGVAFRIARVAVELVLGAGLGAIVGVFGAYAGLNVDLLSGSEASAGFGMGTAVGVTMGAGAGVWLGGYAMRGDGSFGWTLLGSAAGSGAAAAVLALDSRPATLALSATIPLAGAILGYELSSHLRRAPRRPAAAALWPALGPTSVGIGGVF